MLNEKEIVKIVESVIEEEIEINLDTVLIESGLIDSLRLMSIVDKVELSLGITFEIDKIDMEDFETPRKICSLIQKVQQFSDVAIL